jgi:catechol 2,3-dioxygenase-like lactoylglutathione lyase family enzyme
VSSEFRGRFDHAVILVSDLAKASETFTRLGFSVSPGGAHTGLGTHNALVRFGVDYLELLAVRDEAEATKPGSSTASLVERLRSGKGGLASFALATADIERDAARFREHGLPAVGPFAMERLRPDGHRLSWRLLVPKGESWGRPWPFLIQWDQDDATRLSWEKPGAHANGARHVAAVSVAVEDLDASAGLYEETLGLQAVDSRGASRARRSFTTDGFRVDLYAAEDDRRIAERLRNFGEGIFEVTLASASLAETVSALDHAGVDFMRSFRPIVVPEEAAEGARLAFVHDAFVLT